MLWCFSNTPSMYDVLGLLLNLTVRPLYSLTCGCMQFCQGDGTHLKMEFCTDTSSQLCWCAFKPTYQSVLTHSLSVALFHTHTRTHARAHTHTRTRARTHTRARAQTRTRTHARTHALVYLLYLSSWHYVINLLNTDLNPICHLLALLGVCHIFHISGLRVNVMNWKGWKRSTFSLVYGTITAFAWRAWEPKKSEASCFLLQDLNLVVF